MRWPTRSPFATPTIARSSVRPTRTGITCGRAGSATTGKAGGPVVDNAEAGYDWSTFPERLQAAGVTWKVYQDAGAGLDADHFWGWGDNAYIGNYGDNSLLYFHQYQNAPPGNPLHEFAGTGTNLLQGGTLFDAFRADVANGTLPQVSWIVAPEAYSEHPNWPANYGAFYVSQFLDALTENPEVWSKTVLFLMYDENDGFFDHMVPPTPPQSRAEGISTVDTTHEIFPGSSSYAPGPYGLGYRVPMIVISPFSKGGWVDSELFDHTSLIRFLEKRFGLEEPNITAWRRAVVGDLTSTLDFATPNAAVVALPSTDAYVPPDGDRHPDYSPVPPVNPPLPKQEPGLRPSRALPYEIHVHEEADFSEGTVKLEFGNTGKAAVVFQVRSGDGVTGPWTYTVGPSEQVFDRWPVVAAGSQDYDLSVYGPNGFLRAYKGSVRRRDAANLSVRTIYDAAGGITLEIQNRGATDVKVRVEDAYRAHGDTRHHVEAGGSVTWHWSLDASFSWYDLTLTVDSDASFAQRIAGHVETGKDSWSDPALGG